MRDKLYTVFLYTDDLVQLLKGGADSWVFPPDTELHSWQKDAEDTPVLVLKSAEPFTAHGIVLA